MGKYVTQAPVEALSDYTSVQPVKPEGMDTTAKARVSDRKRGSEVAHNSHPIPTGSFLGIEHSSPKYPNGTLPHG